LNIPLKCLKYGNIDIFLSIHDSTSWFDEGKKYNNLYSNKFKKRLRWLRKEMLKICREKVFTYKKSTLQSPLSILNSEFCEFIKHIRLSEKKKHCHLGKSQQSLRSTSKSVSCKRYVYIYIKKGKRNI